MITQPFIAITMERRVLREVIDVLWSGEIILTMPLSAASKTDSLG